MNEKELKNLIIKIFTNFKLSMDDVVIIGGGIIGTATAYFLSKEGRNV